MCRMEFSGHTIDTSIKHNTNRKPRNARGRFKLYDPIYKYNTPDMFFLFEYGGFILPCLSNGMRIGDRRFRTRSNNEYLDYASVKPPPQRSREIPVSKG